MKCRWRSLSRSGSKGQGGETMERAREYHDGKVKFVDLIEDWEGVRKFGGEDEICLRVRTHNEANYECTFGCVTALPLREGHDGSGNQESARALFERFREWEDTREPEYGPLDIGDDATAEEREEAEGSAMEADLQFVGDQFNDIRSQVEEVDFLEVFVFEYSPGWDVGQFGENDFTVVAGEEEEWVTTAEVRQRVERMLEGSTLIYAKNEHDDRWIAGIRLSGSEEEQKEAA